MIHLHVILWLSLSIYSVSFDEARGAFNANTEAQKQTPNLTSVTGFQTTAYQDVELDDVILPKAKQPSGTSKSSLAIPSLTCVFVQIRWPSAHSRAPPQEFLVF